MPHSYRSLPAALLLAALLPLAGRAQANFRPGYVVRPAGDTLRGEVDSRDAYFSSTQCHFRPAAGAEATTYRPTELRAYGLPADGLHYRSFTPPGGPAPVFAQVLVSGPATLYTLRDAERTDRYYLEAPQFALTELAYQRLLLPGRNDYRDEPVYRLTLARALPNCPAAERQLKSLALSGPTLTRVVRAFNECQGVTAPVVRPVSRSHPRFGVLVGGHTVSMRLVYPDPYGQPVAKAVPNVTVPVLGPTLSLPLGVFSRKLEVEVALLYAFPQRYSFDVSTTGVTYQPATLDVRLGYLRLPVVLRYNPLPQARVRPVLEAGATLAYASTLEAITTSSFGQRTSTQPFYPNLQERLQQGLTAGVGLQTSYWQNRRATALFRFEANTGWLRADGFNTDSNRVYLLLGLDLTK